MRQCMSDREIYQTCIFLIDHWFPYARLIGENYKKKFFFFFFNNLPLQIWTLKCSLNGLTLQFCRYDVSALPTPVLNLATFMYKHLLGHMKCFINIKSSYHYFIIIPKGGVRRVDGTSGSVFFFLSLL